MNIQYTSNWKTCMQIIHKPQELCHREGFNIQNFHYWNKPGNIKKDHHTKTQDKNGEEIKIP